MLPPPEPQLFKLNAAIIENAPGITFIWTRTFKLGIYGPMVLPSLIAYVITTVETIGDITATEEVGGEGPCTGVARRV